MKIRNRLFTNPRTKKKVSNTSSTPAGEFGEFLRPVLYTGESSTIERTDGADILMSAVSI
jgi:hypothetical protein